MPSYKKLHEAIVNLIAKVKWDQKQALQKHQVDDLRVMLTKDYYIIATRRSHFLSCFFINLGHFVLTGRWGYYTHTLMNMENRVIDDSSFLFIEAATHGVIYNTFPKIVKNCDAIALLKPKHMAVDEWTAALDRARLSLGKPYDTLFDLSNDKQINCVELVYLALKATPNYHTNFPCFEKMIRKTKTLTPQMFLECSDFEVVWEART